MESGHSCDLITDVCLENLFCIDAVVHIVLQPGLCLFELLCKSQFLWVCHGYIGRRGRWGDGPCQCVWKDKVPVWKLQHVGVQVIHFLAHGTCGQGNRKVVRGGLSLAISNAAQNTLPW